MTVAGGQVPPHGTCLTCRWSQGLDQDRYTEVGNALDQECRRHVPQVVPTGDGGIEAWWPVTSGFDWCGEWEAQRTGR